MKNEYLTMLAAAILGVSGCSVGPSYHPPQASAPPRWSEPLTGGTAGEPVEDKAWWKSFHDAELNSLVTRALRSNLDLRVAEARVRESRAQYRVVEADRQPSIGAAGSYDRRQASRRQPVLGSLPVPAGVPFENNVYQAGFDASWELDVFGGQRRASEMAGAEVAAAEYGARGVLVTLLGDVARNYVDLRGEQRRMIIAQENIKAQEEALAITRDRFSHGLASDLDVQQAASLLATTKAEVPALEAAVQVFIHRLSVLIGENPGALQAELVDATATPAVPPVVPVGLPSDLLLRRPDVRQAERRLAAATASIGVATADLFPKFSLTGSAGFESVSATDWFATGSKFWSAGPTVQWRIFEGGRIRANIKVQTARQEAALALYEKTVLSAFEDVEDALAAYGKEQIRQRALEEAAQSSREALRLSGQLYANGLTDFLRVLDSERSLYRAEDELAQSERAVSANLISLYKALGGGWETAGLQVSNAAPPAPEK